MKSLNRVLFIFFLGLFFVSSCGLVELANRDPCKIGNGLDPIPEDDRDYIGFVVDGEIEWEPFVSLILAIHGDSPYECRYDASKDILFIRGWRKRWKEECPYTDETFLLRVQDVLTEGVRDDKRFLKTSLLRQFSFEFELIEEGSYDIDTLAPYNVSITRVDTTKRIISGTFYFTLINEMNDPDEDDFRLEVTDGRFNTSY
jgi:hypothetical protein